MRKKRIAQNYKKKYLRTWFLIGLSRSMFLAPIRSDPIFVKRRRSDPFPIRSDPVLLVVVVLQTFIVTAIQLTKKHELYKLKLYCAPIVMVLGIRAVKQTQKIYFQVFIKAWQQVGLPKNLCRNKQISSAATDEILYWQAYKPNSNRFLTCKLLSISTGVPVGWSIFLFFL